MATEPAVETLRRDRRRVVHRSWVIALWLSALSACTYPPPRTIRASLAIAPQAPAVGALPTGTRIRYWATGDRGSHPRFDRLARASADSLWLVSGHAIPVAELARLEAMLGPGLSGRRLAWSAGIGAAVGALLGAVVPRDTERQPPVPSRGAAAGLGALAGFIVGVGSWVVTSPREHWTPVPLAPDPGRIAPGEGPAAGTEIR